MLNEKIEFYGKMMSMRAITMEIGISRDTLIKYYEETNDIYEAERIWKKIIEEKYFDYFAEYLKGKIREAKPPPS